MKLFDTHCHLAGTELAPHAEELAERAFAQGIHGMAIIAADEQSLKSSRELCLKLRSRLPQAHIVFSAGIHPHDSQKISDDLWTDVVDCAQTAAAIGETGLDYHYLTSEKSIQIEAFERHIDLACELAKPLVIHCREAADDVLQALSSSRRLKSHPRPGILHCFTESLEVAKKLIDLNFVISFSGILSFKNAQTLREVAQALPLEHVLIETDSPWLAPIPHRGKRNEPAFVKHVLEEFHRLRPQIPMEQLEAQLWQNSCRIFGLS